jgi:RNA polymerase sigma factor (sigma-70 family)
MGTASRTAAGVGDHELLDRFVVEGDDTAFARLVERHAGTIWRLCRRLLPTEQDAEDAYQAVFLVLARKAASIRRGEAVGSWLYSVAYRVALRARKNLQRRRGLEKQAAAVDAARDNPPWSEAALREMQRILDEEVQRLRDKYRAPFVLCCLEGMSRPEAARELGWPEETVKARLAQARQLLRTRLVRRGITLSAVLTAVALTQGTAAAAAPAVLAGSAGAGAALSSSALALAESAVGGIGAAKLKLALGVVLFTTVTVTGTGVMALHLASAARPPAGPKEAPAADDPETFLAPPIPLMKPHDEQVLAVALSPDGRRLVTAGARRPLPGQFMIWDVETHKWLVRLRGMRGIRGVAYSPDGRTIACCGFGNAIHLRDALTGTIRAPLEGHKAGANAVAYSADGALLASAGLDKVVKLWDVNQLAEKKSFVGHTDMVFAVAFFHHGRAVVSGGKDRTAKVWDVESGKVTFDLTCPEAVEAVAVSPDDKTVVTASWDQTIRLWSAETGKEEAVLRSEEGLILGLAFTRDGALLASTSGDGSTRIWDVKTRQTVKRLERHASEVWSAAFTPDGKMLATGSSDTTAKLWDVEAGTVIATLPTAEQKPVRALAYAPDGRSVAVVGRDWYLQVRDAASGDVRRVLPGHTDLVHCVAIAPDGATLASGSADRTIKLWDLATGKEKRTLTGHAGGVLALAFAPDGTLASAGEDGLVKWWPLADGQEPATLRGHDGAVRALAFAPDGTTLASGGADRDIRVWSLGKDTPPRVLAGHAASVRALAFAPDGVLASAGDDGVIKLWEPGADKERQTLEGHAGPVLALTFTPGGRALVSGGEDRQAIVWDPATGKPRTKLTGHGAPVTALAMHPRGDHLITGSTDTTLLRWRSPASVLPAPDRKDGHEEGKATPAAVAGAADPAAKPEADRDYHVRLTSRPDNLPGMELMGPHAKEWLRFTPAGLRITVPPGFTGLDAHVGLYTGIAPRGDFEAVVNFEILKLPEPDDAGPETGVTLSAWRVQSDLCITGVTHRVVEKGVPQFDAWATWFEQPGKPSDHQEKLLATDAKSGRLRLVRRGGEVSYYVSKGLDGKFTLLNQLPIGEQRLDNIRLIAFTGSPRASLDARFWDLRIRTGTIAPDPDSPAAPEVQAEPAKAGSRGWLAALAVIGCASGLLAGVALFLRRRRARAEAPPSPPADSEPAPAVSSVSFSCSCGKPLRARTGLAGKRLRCPGCGAPVVVPEQPPA